MRRRPTRSRRLPDARPSRATGLLDCVLCGRDYVVPVAWEPVRKEGWWIFVRCAQCGTSREVTVSNAVAERYDEELGTGAEAIRRAAHRLEHERMAAEADAFADALRHDLIEPADFFTAP